MKVEQLWRYPVKSIGGERVDRSEVTLHGLDGDRRWGLRDNTTGLFLTARREPQLLMATATLDDDGSPQIRLPDGSRVDNDAALSQWLNKDVSLVAAGEGEATYESPLSVDDETEWYEWTGPGTALHDEPYARVSIVSERTLGAWDVRRVRPNIVVSGSGEVDLVGQTITVGTAIVEIADAIPRCVMVTRPQPGLPRDLDVLKSINRDFGGRLSVGGTVREAGVIEIGDEIVATGSREAL